MDFAPGGICAPNTSSFHHLPDMTKVRRPEVVPAGRRRQGVCGGPALGGGFMRLYGFRVRSAW